MNVLIVEDDSMGALVLERAVRKAGHSVSLASTGTQALSRIRNFPYDVLLVDLILPELDGISLIKAVRAEISPAPFVIVTTSLASPESRARALEAGADDYVTKPYDPQMVLSSLETGLARRAQSPESYKALGYQPTASTATFPVVVLAAGSGGPSALRQIFRQLPERQACAFLVVQQAPMQILETLVHILRNETCWPVELAKNGSPIKPGHVYLAPADRHLLVRDGPSLELNDGPRENYLRPSANPLFRSAAQVFGTRCAAVVLSGLGVDGWAGAAVVHATGGLVLAQNPAEAVDPSMPRHIIESGLAEHGSTISEIVSTLDRELR
jgi:two-component system chemotaxis response regulator CheB